MSFSKPIQQPIKQRALASKQKKVKGVKVTYLRNKVIRIFAVLLPVTLAIVLLVDLLGDDNRFQIESVEYQGKFSFVNKEQVNEVALGSMKGNFFTVNLELMKEKLELIDWVKTARLGKKWPNTVSISIEEYEPKAKWHAGGWISGGELVSAEAPNVDWLNKLPVYQGKLSELDLIDNTFKNWSSRLSSAGIVIKKLVLSEANSWQVVLQGSVNKEFELVLGATANIDQRLMRFVGLYEGNPEHFDNLEYVDARYPNGVAIKYISDSDEPSLLDLDRKNNNVKQEEKDA